MEQLRAAFLDPPKSFRPQPFWFLNHVLDHDLLRGQIAEMADKGVGGMVLHPRHGMRAAFMSNAWLYDDDNWSSGFFGGRLTRHYPENRIR